jgi:hypothetical protein
VKMSQYVWFNLPVVSAEQNAPNHGVSVVWFVCGVSSWKHPWQ